MQGQSTQTQNVGRAVGVERRFLPWLGAGIAAAAVVLAAFSGLPSLARWMMGGAMVLAVGVLLAGYRRALSGARRAEAQARHAQTALEAHSRALEQELSAGKSAIQALQVAQDELSKQHQWMRAVVEHFPGGISVLDSQLRLVEHNGDYVNLLGFPPEMFEGEPRSLADFIRWNAEHGEYGDVDVEEYVAKLMELARRFEPHHFERVRPDGRVLEVRGRPIPGGGFVTSHTDVTARKRAEEQLRQSEEKFARIVNTSPDAIGIARVSDGRYVEINPGFEAITGYTHEEVIGRTAAELAIWTSPDQSRDLVRLYRAQGEVTSHEIVVRAKNGGLLTGLVSVRGMVINGEEHFLFFFRDITERKQYEALERARAAAELASRAKSEFLSRMSHELRTPLNAILGFSQVLEHDARHPLSPQQIVQVQHIQRGGWHLLDMINDVLDLTKIEAGKLALSIEPVSLAQVVADSLPLVTAAAQQAAVSVEDAVAGKGDPWVRADAMRLRQVLVNLLSNGAKYNRPGGRVIVSCSIEAEQVALHVSDTGIGLSLDQIDELFQPFNRVGAENTAVEGTGLGLMITKNLVEYMQGTIEVASRPGVGTTFTVRLPRCEPARASSPRSKPSRAGVAAAAPRSVEENERCTILYIEDNLSNVLVVQSILAVRPQWHLRVANDGPAGLRAARTVRPTLILLDVHLPGMHGLEVLRRLRADPETAAIPCIALSANAMPQEVDAALEAGCMDYWTKPVEMTSFLQRLDALLAQPLLHAADGVTTKA